MSPEVHYGDRVAYVPAADVLVLADLHIGRDSSSNVSLPLGEGEDLRDRLVAALDRFAPGTVVIAGDYLHAFDTIPDGVRQTVRDLERAIAAVDADLVVTRGNHDTALEHCSSGTIVESFRAGPAIIAHGPEPVEVAADLTIVAHEHPAIEFGGRRRPCFLYGAGVREGGDVLVLPAFTRLAAGTPVNQLRSEDVRSPILTPLGSFRPYVHSEGELLEFPPLDSLRSVL